MRPVNINYRCEYNQPENHSPLKQNTKSRQKNSHEMPGNRKEYIKQKIEKLKANAENR